jgi:hypothetical protein
LGKGHCSDKLQDPPTEGTVKASSGFNAEADAKILRTAMKGFGKWLSDIGMVGPCS